MHREVKEMLKMKRWLICALCAVTLLCAGCRPDPETILLGESAQDITAEEPAGDGTQSEEPAEENSAAGESKEESMIYVYVCGAVHQPGVYELKENSRVFLAVEQAGGLTEDADGTSVNLADFVTDGQMIRIPTVEETLQNRGEGSADTPVSSDSGAAAPDAAININTASKEELMRLPGVGETKAQSVISYREKHGAFQNKEEIMQVDGIAEGTFEKMKDRISIQ